MRLWLAGIVAAVGVSTLHGQGLDRAVAEFDQYAAKAVRDWGAVGLGVAVVKDGRTVFAKGYGVRILGQSDPVDPETMFAIGSTTKAITAAAIGILVDEGKVRWDDPVIKHLPWFMLADPVLTREITVRDLLTHRAGLANGDVLWYRTDLTPAEILRRARFIPVAYSPRSSFIYQNVMYAAAGAVVAAASGMSWERFVETRIFFPLGMKRTVPTLGATAGLPNVAAPHQRVDGAVRVIENASVDPVAAAGSAWSSVSDMAKWMGFLLDSARVGGQRLLTQSTWAELFRPQALVPAAGFYPTQQLTAPRWMSYGLGWFQHDYRGRMLQFHTGSIDGMVAIIGLIPELGVGVYLLGNLDHVEVRHALLYRALDVFGFGGPGRDWSADLAAIYRNIEARGDSVRAAGRRGRRTDTRPSLPPSGYAGWYADSLAGKVEVRVEGGALRLVKSSELAADLQHWHLDTFEARWSKPWVDPDLVTFLIGPNATVDALQLGGRRLGRVRER